MRRTLITLALTAAMAGTAAASDFKIGRVYRGAPSWAAVIIHSSKTIRVKCAALDAKGEAIAVSRETTIEPPMDEVSVKVGRDVPFSSARCWVAK